MWLAVLVLTGADTGGPADSHDTAVLVADWCCRYYVKVPPNSGDLVFDDPRGINSIDLTNQTNSDSLKKAKFRPMPPFHSRVCVVCVRARVQSDACSCRICGLGLDQPALEMNANATT